MYMPNKETESKIWLTIALFTMLIIEHNWMYKSVNDNNN